MCLSLPALRNDQLQGESWGRGRCVNPPTQFQLSEECLDLYFLLLSAVFRFYYCAIECSGSSTGQLCTLAFLSENGNFSLWEFIGHFFFFFLEEFEFS
ncbi:hypothetical protein SKAU_G00330920 [Synaphobranchus kaupii]|uniref:Uncharacterized protein n=1 Tax=Synaphobranchus kaupii TaxID=118154 RepID=A0A9Q1IIH1_SYNKA|nr:hypothetical protein SKAU_G00330920 [Synaphobranchus kaupii]